MCSELHAITLLIHTAARGLQPPSSTHARGYEHMRNYKCIQAVLVGQREMAAATGSTYSTAGGGVRGGVGRRGATTCARIAWAFSRSQVDCAKF